MLGTEKGEKRKEVAKTYRHINSVALLRGMAPKKKVPDAQVIDDKQQALENIKRQCQAVEQLLLLASEEIRCIRHEKSVLEKRIAEMVQQQEAAENTTSEQVRAMQRSTSTLSYQLSQRIKSLEQSVATAENENASMRNELETIRTKKTKELERLNGEAAALKKELEEKALNSAVLLREVLLTK